MKESAFSELVRDVLGDLIDEFKLKFVVIDNNEVLLKRKEYALVVRADLDGVNVLYLDLSTPAIKAYSPLMFLFQKRRDMLQFAKLTTEPASRSEFLTWELRAIAKHLRSGGTDILRADKRWLSDYTWPTVEPTAEVLGAL